MPAYRYLLCDLLTDQPIADLPLRGVSFDRRLCRTGSLSASMDASTPPLVETTRTLMSYAGRSALYVYRDGVLWWGGIPWTVTANQGTRGTVQVSVSAATFDSYAHRRQLRVDKTYTQVDSGVIIPDLWRWLQSDPRGNIGVQAVDQPTGNLHDRTYLAVDMPFIGQLIEDLGDTLRGPEHTIDVYLDSSGNRVKALRVGDTLGGTQPQLVFQRSASAGGSVLEWSESADTVGSGTVFQTRGATPDGNVGEDVPPLQSTVVYRDDLLNAGWPLLDVSEDWSDVSVQATLDEYAQALAASSAGAVSTRGYTVQVGNTGWTPNRVGEPVRIKLRDDWHTDSDLTVRPVGCQVQAAERGGSETVTLLFGDD